MTRTSNKPLCRMINTSIYHSDAYLALPDEGHARLVLLYLLIHPHGGSFHVPGLYVAGLEAIREGVRLAKRGFVSAWQQLQTAEVMSWDAKYRVIWIPSALHLLATPANPNMVKGICRSICQMPSSPLIDRAVQAYVDMLAPMGEAYVEPFRNAFQAVCTTQPQPFEDRSTSLSKLNSNSNSYKNIYTHKHSHGLADASDSKPAKIHTASSGHVDQPVDSVALAHYVAEAGWPNASAKRLDSFLMHTEGIRWSDVAACRSMLDQRDDVIDPVAYLFGLLKRRRSCAGLRTTGQDSAESLFDAYTNGQKVKLRD